jgi:hypothetical protein
MPSRFYLIMLAIAGACSLFGLGTMFGLGIVSEPAPPSQIDATMSTTPHVVHRTTENAEEKRIADRKLSPIYPASPGGTESDKPTAESSNGAAKTASANANKPEEERRPEQQDERISTAITESAKSEESAKTDIKPGPPAAPAHANSCDVKACAAAYKSFRESDCTYQPYDGPRRMCVNPPTREQQQASSGRDDADDLRAAVEEVRRMRRAPQYDQYGPYDPPPPSMSSRRRIIIVQPW